ncbi:hypothetical protein, partial [Archangium sp.]|uniref:hypothetical protein n=1 Tax=Archangium sp. TaxID=1872627 RepID=UPI002D70CF3C
MSSQFNPLGPEEPDGTDALEHVLGGDPAGAYLEMDETTREQYRQACRELAAHSGHTPVAVAREAIRLCEEHAPDEPRGRHVGVVLIAEGRPRLQARLGCRTSWRQSLLRGLRRHAPTAYVGGLLTLTVVALLGIERWLAFWGLGVGHRVVLVAAFFIPVLDFIQGQVDAVL